MPLKEGHSKKVRDANIQELIDSWKKTGMIGDQKIKTEKKAREVATAIAYRKAREAVMTTARGIISEAERRTAR